MAVAKLKLVEAPDVEIEGGAPALIPEGEYRLRFDSWMTLVMFGRVPKVCLEFAVIDPGPYFEAHLRRWYNVSRLIGKPGRRGRFKAGWNSNLMREYVQVLGRNPRADRLALSNYRQHIIVGRVATVTHTREQSALPELLRYSVIRNLVGIEKP